MKKFLLLMSMIICFSSFSAFALQDTLWTRETMPYNIKSAIFSPDGQHIYASSDGIPSRLFQYDLNGNLISTNDTVGGIKQFSQDGKYFWNLVGDKYEFATMKRIDSIPYVPGHKPFGFDVSELADIGVAHQSTGVKLDGSYLFLFKPSDMNLITKVLHPEGGYQFESVGISPDGKYIGAGMHKYTLNSKYEYIAHYRTEVWDVEKRAPIKTLYEKDSIDGIYKIHFSPDGKYLGISNERKLFLYSTSDWSLVYTFDYSNTIHGLKSFVFSTDDRNLYIGTDGVHRVNLSTLSDDYLFMYPVIGRFIDESPDRKNIITSYKTAELSLLDNTITSIPAPKEINNISISPNPANDVLNITITPETEQAITYSISNLAGNTVIPNIKKELTAGVNQLVINASELASGVYFFNATLDGQSKSYKFVVER